MSRTITALFDSRADAEAGRERLVSANIDADNVRIHDQDNSGIMSNSHSTTQATGQDTGMWSSIKNAFLPDEDRHTYEEGVRRGGFLLSADVDEHEADEAVAALENANSIDLEERSASWKQEGWSPPAMFGNDRNEGADLTDRDDAAIPIIEEQLVVGKREVDRGGVRVRSYVTETPVHEQVRLRQERVELDRRPVDREVGSADTDAFQERSIEMTETSEEAVVGKTARVVEEVSLRKTSDERVEDIEDTVRKTDVEVENLTDTNRDGLSSERKY